MDGTNADVVLPRYAFLCNGQYRFQNGLEHHGFRMVKG